MPEPTLPRATSDLERRARWAGIVHRLGLPAAGGAAVGLGATVSAGARGPVETLGAVALMAAGAASLGAAAVAHWAEGRSSSVPAPARSAAIEGEPALNQVREGTPSLEEGGDPFEPVRRPLLAPPATAVGTVFSTWTSPGDELWSSWRTADAGHLLAPLVGPVPETAYFPPRVGELDPFAGRAPTLRVDSEHRLQPLTPSGPLPGTGPYPAELLDEWFPLEEAARPEAPPAGPEPVEVHVVPFADAYSVFGAPPEAGSTGFAVHFEAINPTPPHLRASTGRRPVARAARPRAPKFGASVCISCDREVPDLRQWGPCPDCLRPVCSHCLLEALWTHGRGICSECADAGGDEIPFAVDPASGEAVGLSSSSAIEPGGLRSQAAR